MKPEDEVILRNLWKKNTNQPLDNPIYTMVRNIVDEFIIAIRKDVIVGVIDKLPEFVELPHELVFEPGSLTVICIKPIDSDRAATWIRRIDPKTLARTEESTGAMESYELICYMKRMVDDLEFAILSQGVKDEVH